MVLCLLPLDQEHRLQRPAFTGTSLQLLPRPQSRFIFGTLYLGPFTVLYEYLPELGQSSTDEVGRP